MNSVITNGPTKICKSYDSKFLIKEYKNQFNIDISSILLDIESIQLYRCLDTGYEFFHPFNVSGDGEFYEQLDKFHWYYMPWKWEHEQSTRYIQNGMRVLEIGCGQGGFLSEINKRYQLESIGLELNENAVTQMKSKGLKVLNETVQDHAEKHTDTYDMVCSFQVLEHIADVKSFLNAQIKALNKGGKLIVSVPNNDGFLGDDENLLNMPPHHMGLWNEASLLNMGQLFQLKHISTSFEPLQDYHQDYYLKVKSKRLLDIPRPLRLLNRFFLMESLLFPKNYSSFTIQVVWEK